MNQEGNEILAPAQLESGSENFIFTFCNKPGGISSLFNKILKNHIFKYAVKMRQGNVLSDFV